MSPEITIADIAKHTGFDKSTVSLVLSRNEAGMRISEPTRQRIVATAKHLNYRPNMLARGLRGGRTHSVGILLSLALPDAVRVARSLAVGAMEHKCTPYVVDSQGDPKVMAEVLNDLLDRRADGVILEVNSPVIADVDLVMTLKQFRAAVLVGLERHEDVGLDQVVHDRFGAICTIAEHFVRSGRRRPAFLTAEFAPNGKVKTFVSRLREYDIDVATDNVVNLQYDLDKVSGEWYWAKWAYEALEARFTNGRIPFDSLLCGSDEMAAAAMSWLRKRGLKIPEDVAVVGFNDSEASRYFDPPLASVDRRSQEVSALLERMLFERLENPDLPIRTETIAMDFVRRESAG